MSARAIKTIIFILASLQVSAQLKTTKHDSLLQQPLSTVFIPSNFISNKQGYACRQEWKMEKKTGIPFRFRLGSLEYVNRMEGK